MKEFRQAERDKKHSWLPVTEGSEGIVDAVAAVATDFVVDAVDVVVADDLCVDAVVHVAERDHRGVLEDFLTYLASSSFPHQVEMDSLESLEADAICDWHVPVISSFQSNFFAVDDHAALLAASSSFSVTSHSFNLSKAPSSYSEAITQSNAPVWHSAIVFEGPVYATEKRPKTGPFRTD